MNNRYTLSKSARSRNSISTHFHCVLLPIARHFSISHRPPLGHNFTSRSLHLRSTPAFIICFHYSLSSPALTICFYNLLSSPYFIARFHAVFSSPTFLANLLRALLPPALTTYLYQSLLPRAFRAYSCESGS